MAKAALKVAGELDTTTMRLPNVGPAQAEFDRAREGMREAGLL
jgi:4-hydroxy-tetrahydrodipicolinate synthase